MYGMFLVPDGGVPRPLGTRPEASAVVDLFLSRLRVFAYYYTCAYRQQHGPTMAKQGGV